MTRRHLAQPGEADSQPPADSGRTVLTALAANVAIALAKGAATVFTGSAALWAETAHSLADTGNELLLLVGLRRSRRREDAQHPFGYGQERFFWAFLASLGIFLVGGVLSIGEGVRSLHQAAGPRVDELSVGVVVPPGSAAGHLAERSELGLVEVDPGLAVAQPLG